VGFVSKPGSLGRAALAGLAVGGALFAGIGTAQARFFVDVGIGLPGVVVAPPVVMAPVPVPAAPVEAVPAAPAPGYVWAPGRYVLPPWPGGVWLAGGWYRGPQGWAWRRGYWR
jgi:hypothetical protein